MPLEVPAIDDLLKAAIGIVIYTAGVRMFIVSKWIYFNDELTKEKRNAAEENHSRSDFLSKLACRFKLHIRLLSFAAYAGLLAVSLGLIGCKILTVVFVVINLALLAFAHLAADCSWLRDKILPLVIRREECQS